MQIEKLSKAKAKSKTQNKKSKGPNYCGGFKPPKGHLDTQLFPECKGHPTDRDIVKKTTDKRKKKNKKKESSNKIDKIDKYAKLGAYLEGQHSPWDQWKNSPKLFEDNNIFIKNIKTLLEHGGNQFLPVLSDYEPMRKMISKAINFAFTGKSEEAYLEAANKINVALNYAEPILAKNKNNIKIAKKKKKEKELNPWAICTDSIAKTEGTTERSKWSEDAKDRYERCILEVKKQDKDKKETKSFNLKNSLKKLAMLLPDDVEYYEDSGIDRIPKIPGYYMIKEHQKWGWCPTYRNEKDKSDILYYDKDTQQLLNWLEMKDLLRANWRPASREEQDWWVTNLGENGL